MTTASSDWESKAWRCKPYMIWYVTEFTEGGKSTIMPFTPQHQHDYFRNLEIKKIRKKFEDLYRAVALGIWWPGMFNNED